MKKKKMPKTKGKFKKTRKKPARSQKRDLSVLFFLLLRPLTTCDWFTGPLFWLIFFQLKYLPMDLPF